MKKLEKFLRLFFSKCLFHPKVTQEVRKMNTKAIVEGNNEKQDSTIQIQQELRLDTIKPGWNSILEREFNKPYFLEILRTLEKDKAHLCPKPPAIFNCLTYFEPAETRVVIIGQDPYHTPGVAMGLAFSVHETAKIPPSLRNIYKEIKECYPTARFENGSLRHWAEQGVLLLNTTLTAVEGKPKSHSDIGWLNITKQIMRGLSHYQHIVYILWGAHAQTLKPFVIRSDNLILTCGHPSPFSVKHFTGNKHFLKANQYLKDNQMKEIRW